MMRPLLVTIAYLGLFAALLFGGAGTFAWPSAWILLAVLALVRIGSTLVLSRTRAALLKLRSGIPLHPDQPLLDRMLLPLFMATFAAQVGFTAWDRWHGLLLGAPPWWLGPPGLLLFAFGFYLAHASLRDNDFAVTVVRHQDDRSQRIVTTGVYGRVRHPMYAGQAPVMVGLALWLGSWAGAVASIIPLGILAVRIVIEERLLGRNFPEYLDYARRVRWRLVPGLW